MKPDFHWILGRLVNINQITSVEFEDRAHENPTIRIQMIGNGSIMKVYHQYEHDEYEQEKQFIEKTLLVGHDKEWDNGC